MCVGGEGEELGMENQIMNSANKILHKEWIDGGIYVE